MKKKERVKAKEGKTETNNLRSLLRKKNACILVVLLNFGLKTRSRSSPRRPSTFCLPYQRSNLPSPLRTSLPSIICLFFMLKSVMEVLLQPRLSCYDYKTVAKPFSANSWHPFVFILSLIRERERLKKALLELSRNCASCPKAMEFLSGYAGENDKENVASACQIARWQTSN